MTFRRRCSACIANARVSSTETPNSVCSSSASSIHFGFRTPSATGADLDQRALDRLAVARVAPRHVAQEARAEGDVAVLVAGDVREALHEGRQRPLLLVVVDDEVLAGEGEHPLDDHVVDRHELDRALEVLGLARQAVGAALELLVEEVVELRVEVLVGRAQAVVAGRRRRARRPRGRSGRRTRRGAPRRRSACTGTAHRLVGHGAHERRRAPRRRAARRRRTTTGRTCAGSAPRAGCARASRCGPG